MRKKLLRSLNSTTSAFFNLLLFILLINYILFSHIFGMGSDISDLDGSQTAVADDIEDEYETVRRQHSASMPTLPANNQNQNRNQLRSNFERSLLRYCCILLHIYGSLLCFMPQCATSLVILVR